MLLSQAPKEINPDDKTDTGLRVLAMLFTSGSFDFIIKKVLDNLDGISLTALQMAHPVLDKFIEVKGMCGI